MPAQDDTPYGFFVLSKDSNYHGDCLRKGSVLYRFSPGPLYEHPERMYAGAMLVFERDTNGKLVSTARCNKSYLIHGRTRRIAGVALTTFLAKYRDALPSEVLSTEYAYNGSLS